MPPKLDRCVQHVMAQGKDQSSAYAICTKSLGLGKLDKQAGFKGALKRMLVHGQRKVNADKAMKNYEKVLSGTDGTKFAKAKESMQKATRKFQNNNKMMESRAERKSPVRKAKKMLTDAHLFIKDSFRESDRLQPAYRTA